MQTPTPVSEGLVQTTTPVIGLPFDMERFTKGKLNGENLVTSCCNCNKIQDPVSGEWLEITPPKEVMLSHSYCLPCVKQLYPEIYANVLASMKG